MKLNPWFVIPVLAAGVVGALIGGNIARVTCAPVDVEATCQSPDLVFAIIGAIMSMVGVAVVIALVIRSLSEWREMARKAEDDG